MADLEPAKDVHQILRERRETLDRVRISLNTVERLQRQFDVKSTSSKIAPQTLRDVIASTVKMITLNQLSICLTLDSNESVEIKYPTAEALSGDLKAWAVTPQDLTRLNIKARH